MPAAANDAVIHIFFSDVFGVTRKQLDAHGAFDISLATDLPLFIDPFLLFNSEKPAYQELHRQIVGYLVHLRNLTRGGPVDSGLRTSLFCFPEVRQNWFGYATAGNRGQGLGPTFAHALHGGLESICKDFGAESITRGSHLEKLCLIRGGVGRDKVSDLTTNLIKAFLCRYTETFATERIEASQRRRVTVAKAEFSIDLGRWMPKTFELPWFADDYVLLTPKDILTREDTWISRSDLFHAFHEVAESLPNAALRAHINDYLWRTLDANSKKEDQERAVSGLLSMYPELYDYYIKFKEDRGAGATNISKQRVAFAETAFQAMVTRLVSLLAPTAFFDRPGTTFDEALERVRWLKHVIEDRDGYRVFYIDHKPISREADLQVMFLLTWCGTRSDLNREVNNGRGPVDFKVSRAALDSSLVEFKLGSNSKLRVNLVNQTKVYERANPGSRSIRVILCLSDPEMSKVRSLLKELALDTDPSVVVIDARRDNKPSGSVAR